MTTIQEINSENLSLDDIVELHWSFAKDCYVQRPVDVQTFISDPYFLGGYFKGTRSFYPFWMGELKAIYPTPFHSPYYELIWDLPIGSGKSLSATTIILYEIYKLSCLKDPNAYYGLAKSIPIVFTIFSASLSLSSDVNWEYFDALLSSSPYFAEHCPMPKEGKLKSEMSVVFPKNIQITLGSQQSHALGKAVFGGMLDEANFQRVKSNQAKDGYLAIKRRRESRFIQEGGSLPGKLILLSSPKLATDFLEEQKKSSGKIKTTKIIQNLPIWEIRRGAKRFRNTYSGNRFKVFAGDSTQDPFILDEHPDKKPSNASLVLDVPVEHRDSFESDLPSAIRDIAGRAVSGAWAFISSPNRIKRVMTMKNRFKKNVINLDFFDKEDVLWNYCEQEYFDGKLPFSESYRFIHIDIGISRDSVGMASVFALPDNANIGTKKPKDEEDEETEIRKRDRTFFCEWILYVQAKPEQEIPIFKLREFIFLLKKKGYPILKVTADQFQSKDTLQLMKINGIDSQDVSVDKTRIPYITTRELMYQGKLLLPNHPLLFKEFQYLQDNTKKIDHPSDGSKDGSDAVAGAVWSCATSPVILRPDARFPDLTQTIPMSSSPKANRMLEAAFQRSTVEELAKKLYIGGGFK